MKIERYRRRGIREVTFNEKDGSAKGRFFEEYGEVEFFTFPGNARDHAFTAMKMWIYPHAYICHIPRHYHYRWHGRLTRLFAWACWRMANAEVRP